MKRVKISKGYTQSGYGNRPKSSPIIYLIYNRLYAKDLQGHKLSFQPLMDELSGYVRINAINIAGAEYYHEVLIDSAHDTYKPITITKPLQPVKAGIK